MIYCLRHLCLFLFLFLVAQPVLANEEVNKHVEELRSLFEESIKTQQKRSENTPQQLVYDGEVTVESSGSYYAVTLPYVKIIFEDGSRTELGILSINASPGAEEGEWKMAMAIPSPIVSYDENDQESSRVIIGKQKTISISQNGLPGFSKLDLQLGDITVKSAKPRHDITIPSIKARYNFEKDKHGDWSGPAIITLNNIAIDAPSELTKVTIDQVRINGTLDQYNEKKENNPEKIAENTPVEDVISMVFDQVFSSMDGFVSQYIVSGLKFERKDPNGQKPDVVVSFDEANFEMGTDGMLTNTGTLHIYTGFNNLMISPKPKEYDDVAPSDTQIKLTLKNIPFQDLSAMGKQILASTAANPDMMKMAAISSLMTLPAMLTKAQLHLDIHDSFVSGKTYKTNFDGVLLADANAANSATAEIRMTFHGLDKMLAQAQMLAVNADAKYAKEFQSLKELLETIKRYATVEVSKDETFIHILNIVMNKEGKVLFNGEEFLPSSIGQTQDENTIQEQP